MRRLKGKSGKQRKAGVWGGKKGERWRRLARSEKVTRPTTTTRDICHAGEGEGGKKLTREKKTRA